MSDSESVEVDEEGDGGDGGMGNVEVEEGLGGEEGKGNVEWRAAMRDMFAGRRRGRVVFVVKKG